MTRRTRLVACLTRFAALPVSLAVGGAAHAVDLGTTDGFISVARQSEWRQGLADLGDVNGDGYPDLGVHASQAEVCVHYGGPDMPSNTDKDCWSLYAKGNEGIFAAGDHNGDGFDDVIAWQAGTFLLQYGSASGVSTTPA